MKRNYSLINKNYESIPFNDYEPIDILNLDMLVNCSADAISCTCLEYEANEQISIILNKILSKLKPQGILTIYLTDIKQLMSSYLSGVIDSKNIFRALQNKQSVVSLDDICPLIDNNSFSILQIDSLKEYIVISIQKLSI